jgi:hypothetical protein
MKLWVSYETEMLSCSFSVTSNNVVWLLFISIKAKVFGVNFLDLFCLPRKRRILFADFVSLIRRRFLNNRKKTTTPGWLFFFVLIIFIICFVIFIFNFEHTATKKNAAQLTNIFNYVYYIYNLHIYVCDWLTCVYRVNSCSPTRNISENGAYNEKKIVRLYHCKISTSKFFIFPSLSHIFIIYNHKPCASILF